MNDKETYAALPRLDQMHKDDFRDVVRVLRPNITDEEYEVMWEEFIARRAMHHAN